MQKINSIIIKITLPHGFNDTCIQKFLLFHLNYSKAIKTMWKTRYGDKCNPVSGEANKEEILLFVMSKNIKKPQSYYIICYYSWTLVISLSSESGLTKERELGGQL